MGRPGVSPGGCTPAGWTATALGRLGVPEAAGWLTASLDDAGHDVRAAAGTALRRLSGAPPP